MNAPVRFQMHTSPFSLLNLAESCTDYNHDGSGVRYFKPQPYRYKRYWEGEMPCFAAFGHAASRHMIPVANFVRTLSESAFFNPTLFGRGLAGSEVRRREMIFERTGPSWYSCGVFAAWVGLSRDAGTACTAGARGFPDFTLMCAGRRSGPPRLRCARPARE